MTRPKGLFLVALSILCLGDLNSSFAAFLDSTYGPFKLEPYNGLEIVGSFIVPNEHDPDRFLPFYKNSAPGIELSVGSLRSDFGFLQNPNATHLLVVDIQDGVILFRQLFRILLTNAPTAFEFKKLYQGLAERNFDAHIALFKGLELSPEDRKIVENKRVFEFLSSRWLHIFEVLLSEQKNFEAVNFLKYEHLYSRLRGIAVNGLMEARQIDLDNNIQLIKLRDALLKEHLQISSLNMSNVFNGFLGTKSLGNLLRGLGPTLQTQTVILETLLPELNDVKTLNWIYYGTRKSDWDEWEERKRADPLPRLRSALLNDCTKTALDSMPAKHF